MLEIFVKQYFRLLHMCVIYSLHIVLLVNNICVRNFHRFGRDENYLTTKNLQITVFNCTVQYCCGAFKCDVIVEYTQEY